MNIYEKLQTCRVELQDQNLKKSGLNKFAGYDYFELQDFLPQVNKLFLDHKLFSYVTFSPESAILTIVDSEKPEERILFNSPMATATLKGCHDIQNLGAVESYQRRYLYLAALEISENDALDKTTGKTDKPEPPKKTNTQPPKPPATRTVIDGEPPKNNNEVSNPPKDGSTALCDDCGAEVASDVIAWCQKNSERYKGRLLCKKCQSKYPPTKK